jgi:hypothetical protein
MGVLAAAISPAAAFARTPDTRPRETRALERAKSQADRTLQPSSRTRAARPRTQLFNNAASFAGMQATDNELWAGYTPPDPTGSAGPGAYVEIVNSRIAAYDKTDGTALSDPTDLQTFFIDNGLALQAHGSDPHANPGDSVFDVQVQWDSASDRWLIASADVQESGNAALIYGWSKSADPTGAWCIYRTTPVTAFEDYPKLGHDGTHLMIGTNEFQNSSESSLFLGSKLWTTPTPPTGTIGSCPAAPLTVHSITGGFTPVPVNIADASSGTTTGYVVATSGSGTSSALRLYTVDNTGTPSSGPALVSVNSFSAPPNVQQPGTGDLIDSQDGRLTQAVGIGGKIWTQHTVRSADGQRAEVRWYELDPLATNKLVQEGSVSDLSNSVFNGAISPSADGTHAALQYNVGGAFHLVELRSQTRQAATPLGTMENELTIAGSAAIDQDFSCDDGLSCRWGDYAGASPDPAVGNEDVVWGTNQLNGAIQPSGDPSWLTRNFAVQFGGTDPPPTASADGFPLTSATPSPIFNFASSETGSTFQCSIDGGPSSACTPGKAFGPALPNGTHTFAVIATDAAGQPSVPAQASFTIAAPPPDTLIDSGPPTSGTSRTASFSFHSSKAGSTFQCSLDGSAFTACASPFTKTHLATTQHAFAVRAIDVQGNVDPTPAASSFRTSLAAASATVRGQTVSRKGTVSVKVSCPAVRELACTGTITLTSGIKLGSARFRVAAGRTTTIRVKLTKAGRKRLQAKKRLKAKATIRFNSPAKRTVKSFILRKR